MSENVTLPDVWALCGGGCFFQCFTSVTLFVPSSAVLYCFKNPSLVHVITAACTVEMIGSAWLTMVQCNLKEVCRVKMKPAKAFVTDAK